MLVQVYIEGGIQSVMFQGPVTKLVTGYTITANMAVIVRMDNGWNGFYLTLDIIIEDWTAWHSIILFPTEIKHFNLTVAV